MGKRVARKRGQPRLRASDDLRLRLAAARGDVVAKTLTVALYYPLWMRWVFSLQIAMQLERAVYTAETMVVEP